MTGIKIVKKPWGAEWWLVHTSKYAGKILFVKKGCRLSLQYHRKKDESFFIDKGSVKVFYGKNLKKLSVRIMKEGDVIHIPPRTLHRMQALKNCRLIEVSTPELHDVVRIDDDYNRIPGK